MQGISVYQRAGRPTWYVAYDCPRRGRRINESSGFRIDNPNGKLQAYAYAREKSHSGVTHGLEKSHERWDAWAELWLKVRYKNKAKTLTSYLGAWKHLSFFLHERKIFTPRQLQYEDVVAFVHWREGQVKKRSKRTVSRNTALHNVKVLSRLMREAVRRGYAQGNPCVKLSEDVPPERPPEKPEFTNEEIEIVRFELARRAKLGRPSDWMAIAFEIAIHQGCRLSATQIPMERIDFRRWTITFHEKGEKEFTVPVHPGLRPLLERLRDEGRTVTCTLPFHAPRNFSRVMRAIGLPHTFHSTRVSVITRMARSDVTEQKAMAYVHHGSWAVHKIYTKLRPPDVAGVAEALALPEAFSAAPTRASPQSPGDRQTTAKPSPASSNGQ